MSNENTLKHIAKFYAAYKIILKEPTKFNEMKRELISGGMPETSARRYLCEFCYRNMEDWLGVEIMPVSVYEERKKPTQ